VAGDGSRRKLTAILAAEVLGYSRQMTADGGRLFETARPGDGFPVLARSRRLDLAARGAPV
jgi:hypothetical protein